MSKKNPSKRKAKLKDRRKAGMQRQSELAHEARNHNPLTCPDCIRRLAAMKGDALQYEHEVMDGDPLDALGNTFMLGSSEGDTVVVKAVDIYKAFLESYFSPDEEEETTARLMDALDELGHGYLELDIDGGLHIHELDHTVICAQSEPYAHYVERCTLTITALNHHGGAYRLQVHVDHRHARSAPLPVAMPDNFMVALSLHSSRPLTTSVIDEMKGVTSLKQHLMAEAFSYLPTHVPKPHDVPALTAEADFATIRAMAKSLVDRANQITEGQREIKVLKAVADGNVRTIEVLQAKLERQERARKSAEARANGDAAVAAPVAPVSQDQLLQALQDQCATLSLALTQRKDEMSAMREEIYNLQTTVLQLSGAERLAAAPEEAHPSDPDSFDDLEVWAASELRDRVVLHPKAVTAAKESNYHNPAKVYAALRALAEAYWPLLYAPTDGAAERWQQRCAEIGVESSPVGEAAVHHKTRSAYEVLHNGAKRTLDMHLRGNSSFDTRFGLRVYFTRLDQEKKVLVGALPAHLPNRASN